MSPSNSSTPAPTAPSAIVRNILLSGLAGFGILGCLLGGLTLRLNPRLAADSSDSLILSLYFIFGYSLVGLVLGLGGAVVALLIRRFLRHNTIGDLIVLSIGIGLLLVPLVYFMLLPDVGVGGDLLTQLIFNSSRPVQLAVLATILGLLFALGWMLHSLLVAAAGRLGLRHNALVWGLSLLGLLLAMSWSWFGRPVPPPEPDYAIPAKDDTAPSFQSSPLVLLCIDGADFQIIDPMIEAGELPAFARLLKQGTAGPLATLQPTRSPNIWTSIVTGKTPDVHGIRHFVAFRFPGLKHPVEYFPRHTGLNFQIIPRLESLPGMPPLQAPYTSNLRRSTPLWQIIGQHQSVGLYRWLVTWPAEPVNGFNIAASVAADAMQIVDGHLEEKGQQLSSGVYYPDNLNREIRRFLRELDWQDDDVAPYIAKDQSVPEDHPKLEKIREVLNDPTLVLLPLLRDRFQPHFLAAGFYSVDSFQHFFSTAVGSEGPFAEAIAARYRYSDARLGEFLDQLTPDTHVIVLSDHGFDFVHHHHSEAPPGIFIATGPAFEPGRWVEDLSVYDIAPMILHLLGLPLAEDMDGTGTGTYRQALTESFLAENPARTLPSYEYLRLLYSNDELNPREDEIRRELKNLGYIN